MVECLERQAALHGGVAHAHGDALGTARIAGPQEVACRGQPHPDADPGPRVATVEDVVLALAATREAADPTGLPQRIEPIPAAGEQLVGVGLMPRVPHDPVAR